MAEAETFDSGDEETPEEKKRTPEERRQTFRRELAAMLFGFGDAKAPSREPWADTLEQLEAVLLANSARRLGLEDVHSSFPKEYARVRELLSLSEELKRARKPFEQMKELSD
ncbi:hypothetical protein M3Y99_00222700 [Aphelenchoides fujianensis]|nr:hypothetical protein M3Y99_00222700 [Aphelenchoides fujianensis]